MWNRNFNLLLTANFFLYTAVYMLFPVLHRWMVGEGGYTNLQAGGTIAIFGISLYIFGVFNNYLVDTFKRKAVCTRSILLLALVGLIYPYSPGIGTIVALRVLQGALFGVVLMSMGSTLVIDVTPTHCRNRANLTFTWSGVLGMLCGIWGGYSLGGFPFLPARTVPVCHPVCDTYPAGIDGGSLFPRSAGFTADVVRPLSAVPHPASGTEHDGGPLHFGGGIQHDIR